MTGIVENLEIVKIKNNKKEVFVDKIITELPLTIYLNDVEIVTLLCTPNSLKELAIGFLLSEGFIKNFSDVKSMSLDYEKMIVWVNTKNPIEISKDTLYKRMFTSSCAKGITFYNADGLLLSKKAKSEIKITPEICLNLVKELDLLSKTFKLTGGTHSAAISDYKKILIFKEDIGRHNAIDKVFGECIIKKINTEDKILITSGRISSEIIIKAAKRGIPIVISHSAPTSLAIKIADKLNITIVGFARGNRINIYTRKWRIIENERQGY